MAQSGPAKWLANVRFEGGLCCKTRGAFEAELDRGFWPWPCTALPWREERHRRLCWASDCQRWWGTANEPDEPPQVLRGCGQ